MTDLYRDVAAYAALSAELAEPGAHRSALLAVHGLDEDAWNELDEAWQARLSEADESEEDGVPPLIEAYAEAFVQAQRARERPHVSFEQFVAAARVVKRGEDLDTALGRLGLTLQDFLGAERHWTQAMLADADLAERFRREMF